MGRIESENQANSDAEAYSDLDVKIKVLILDDYKLSSCDRYLNTLIPKLGEQIESVCVPKDESSSWFNNKCDELGVKCIIR